MTPEIEVCSENHCIPYWIRNIFTKTNFSNPKNLEFGNLEILVSCYSQSSGMHIY